MDFDTTTPLQRVDALVAEVLRLAAAHPDYVYQGPNPGSSYYYLQVGPGAPEGVTGCIIGTALSNLGHPPRKDVEQTPVVWVASYCLGLGIHTANIARRLAWLGNVQAGQDNGHAWGLCPESATNQIGFGPGNWGSA